ncbi:MAG: hypothetical protein HY599_05445 [Candidatus Omnitrophica bacterium]|nr:hypothetical protein [Candidatus Omnitrophota bacterium]
MQVGVLLVHGIGDQGPDWADGTIQSLKARLASQLAALLPGQPPVDLQQAFVIGRAHWADVLQEHQRALRRMLEAAHAPAPSSGSWWRRLLGVAAHEARRQESRFIAEFVGDVIGYRSPATRAAIYETITSVLNDLLGRLEPGSPKVPLTIIAHSLGTVISSDYVWDLTNARRAKGRDGFHDRWRLENFFTAGSPLALFSLQYGGPALFNQPIAVESPRGRWVNLYDPNDPIAMPLKPLNEAYYRVVLADAPVRAGTYLLAHMRYFEDEETLTIISRKLALDWCASSARLPEARLRELGAHYDRTLGLAPAA